MNQAELEGKGWDVESAFELLAGQGWRWMAGQNLIIDRRAGLLAPAAVKPNS